MMKHLPISIKALVLCMLALPLVSHDAIAQTPTIAITEIMYNPPESGNDSLEYIEIYNYGASPVDLSGFTFTGISLTIPDDIGSGQPPILPVGAYAVFAINPDALENTLGAAADAWDSGALNNSGEGLSIRDANGVLVDTVFYDNSAPWPTSADGQGASLERCDPQSNGTSSESWIASTTAIGSVVNGIAVFGTPGDENSECGTVGIDDPIITTVTAYPNPSLSGEFLLSEAVSGVVCDMVGKVVAQVNASRIIDLSTVASGEYILRSDQGQVLRLMR